MFSHQLLVSVCMFVVDNAFGAVTLSVSCQEELLPVKNLALLIP